ncbi:helix-turn-helix domain-containing protein [Pseudarthrobacter sp. PH31-O2]|uniref:helix-turn-helix domain-containing protein n=1 Tax=Pseudarthrobacter sp. PH31-O2 TaxID=3046206 RepID=UPI0024BB7007|nr:helix-turn-helix domain-containing protein [Pseudarthrobacter sp. PH31-O2]MDJ0354475.1 helix-turn-helix domain-containing protein [Pseudarthrobacter sp. PH31-O2]
MQISSKPLAPVTDQGKPVQFMTTEEVAVWLQIAQKTLRNWRSAGLGPPTVKLYSAVRYDRAVVEAWIEETSKAAA